MARFSTVLHITNRGVERGGIDTFIDSFPRVDLTDHVRKFPHDVIDRPITGYSLRYNIKLMGILLSMSRTSLVVVHTFPALYVASFFKRLGLLRARLLVIEHRAHTNRRKGGVMRLLDRMFYFAGENFVCVSETVRRNVLEWLFGNASAAEPPKPVVAIQNGVPEPESRAECMTGPRRTLAFVGRFVDEKQPLAMFQIASNLKDSLDKMVLIGDGPLRAEMEQQATALRAKGIEVVFTGSVDRPWQHVPRDSVVVLPSKTEGMPLVPLEAQLRGLPVVGSAVGGMVEALDSGQRGWLISPPNDLQEFARVLRLVLANDSEVQQRVQHAQDWAYQNATAPQMGRRYIELLKSN